MSVASLMSSLVSGLLMSSPECPGWYPHHPVGWLTPSNRKGLLPWPTMLTEEAERSLEWVTSYPLWVELDLKPDNNFMRRTGSIPLTGDQICEKTSCCVTYSSWLHTLNLSFTCSSDCQEESCESAIHENIAEMKSGWKHAVSFSKGLDGRLPLSKLGAGHVLEATADRMQSIFLSVRTEPHPVPLSHRGGPYRADHLCLGWLGWHRHSRQEHASPQSAVSSRCAIPLFSFIHISNSLAPGSSPWVILTVCSVACGALALESHTLASLSQAKRVQLQNPCLAYF